MAPAERVTKPTANTGYGPARKDGRENKEPASHPALSSFSAKQPEIVLAGDEANERRPKSTE
jgi:hypothetical protein